MRLFLIEALAYPRSMMLRLVDEQNCPRAELFDAESEICRHCPINGECHWAAWLSEQPNLDDKPTHTLNASLRHGLKLIKSRRGESQHEPDGCRCDECNWIRSAEALVAAFEATRPKYGVFGLN